MQTKTKCPLYIGQGGPDKQRVVPEGTDVLVIQDKGIKGVEVQLPCKGYVTIPRGWLEQAPGQ